MDNENLPLIAKINLIVIWTSSIGFIILMLVKYFQNRSLGENTMLAAEIIAAIITAVVSIFTTILTIIFTRNKTEKRLIEQINQQLGLSDDKTLFQFLKDHLGTSNDCSLTAQHKEIKENIIYQNQMVQALYQTAKNEKIRQDALKDTGYDMVHVIDTIKTMSKQLNDQTIEIEKLRKENKKLLSTISNLQTQRTIVPVYETDDYDLE